ncbi:hypothetical protein KIN20_034293 [Parelaphostrongylus tenuis]|uniref:Myosin-2 essential light chain n=1 Tax=Parelaphostrongylus tenuis TaxID=148309 RepID=A0AAD5WJK0_PARTN|nr:hypothetical protein KIN20_034293 [Parelaphostrongylus tenuis]
MRFSAILSEQGSVESFSRSIGAISRMCKKRCGLRITDEGMCFVASDTLREQGHFLSVLIPSRPDFEVFNFAGVSEERNEIVMELDVDYFEKSVCGAQSYLKIKLRQKSDQKPFLQLELRDRGVVHELPIKLVKIAHWDVYQRPIVAQGMMGVYFPPVKSVMRILQSLKHVGNRNITVKVSNSGEMHLKCRINQAEITVYFTDLANDTVAEQQSQDHWCTVRLSLKVIHMFFSSFMFMAHSNVLLIVVSHRFAEFILRRDGALMVSAMDDQLADCREVFCYFDSRGDDKISVQQEEQRQNGPHSLERNFSWEMASDIRRGSTRGGSPTLFGNHGERPTERPSLAVLEIARRSARPVFYIVSEEDEVLKEENPRTEIGRCCAAYEKEARLSFEDFVPIFQSISKNREKHTVEEFVEGLSHFDKEGNGLINVAELRHLLTTLGERLSDEEVDQLLAGHNDSHGNVNIADFVRNVMNS